MLLCSFSIYSQNQSDKSDKSDKSIVACIAFYNLENFFDTIKDPARNDEDYTPNGKYHWNTEKYNNKLKNISKVISELGNELVKGGPVIMGIAEVETTEILKDLVNTDFGRTADQSP